MGVYKPTHISRVQRGHLGGGASEEFELTEDATEVAA